MSKKQKRLMRRAWKRFGTIMPCGTRRSLAECFSSTGHKLILWYNTPDGSTHVEIETEPCFDVA